MAVPDFGAVRLNPGYACFVDRPTVLPPDVFQRFSNRAFWRNPKSNPRKVRVLLPADPGAAVVTPTAFAPPPKAQAG